MYTIVVYDDDTIHCYKADVPPTPDQLAESESFGARVAVFNDTNPGPQEIAGVAINTFGVKLSAEYHT